MPNLMPIGQAKLQDCGRPPSWIFKNQQLPARPIRGPIYMITLNLMWIGQLVASICPIFDFYRWRLHTILNF